MSLLIYHTIMKTTTMRTLFLYDVSWCRWLQFLLPCKVLLVYLIDLQASMRDNSRLFLKIDREYYKHCISLLFLFSSWELRLAHDRNRTDRASALSTWPRRFKYLKYSNYRGQIVKAEARSVWFWSCASCNSHKFPHFWPLLALLSRCGSAECQHTIFFVLARANTLMSALATVCQRWTMTSPTIDFGILQF